MTTHAAGSASHLTDTDLVRLLDCEQTANERVRWDAHIATCPQCAGEIERLRDDAALVTDWLERAAFETALPHHDAHAALSGRSDRPHASGSTRTIPAWLRAAAILMLAAAPVAALTAVPAVRAWLFGGAEQPAQIVDTPAEGAAAASAATLRFVPGGDHFAVQLDAPQPAGTLRISYGAGDDAILDIIGEPGAGPVVSAAGVRIRNAPESSASYVLDVPVTVASVTVHIAGRSLIVLDADALREGAEVSIRPVSSP